MDPAFLLIVGVFAVAGVAVAVPRVLELLSARWDRARHDRRGTGVGSGRR